METIELTKVPSIAKQAFGDTFVNNDPLEDPHEVQRRLTTALNALVMIRATMTAPEIVLQKCIRLLKTMRIKI